MGPEPRASPCWATGGPRLPYKSGDVVFLDAATGRVLKAGTDVYRAAQPHPAHRHRRRAARCRCLDDLRPGPGPINSRRGLEAITGLSPNGTHQLYVAGLLSGGWRPPASPGPAGCRAAATPRPPVRLFTIRRPRLGGGGVPAAVADLRPAGTPGADDVLTAAAGACS